MTGRQHLDPSINVFIRHIDCNFLTLKKTAQIRMASHINSGFKDLMFIFVHISAAHLFGVVHKSWHGSVVWNWKVRFYTQKWRHLAPAATFFFKQIFTDIPEFDHTSATEDITQPNALHNFSRQADTNVSCMLTTSSHDRPNEHYWRRRPDNSI